MTALDFAAMTDEQLDEAAALAMGWKVKRREKDYCYWDTGAGFDRITGKNYYDEYEFNPSVNLNHAAEFSAWFLQSHPDCHVEKWKHADWSEVHIVRDICDQSHAIIGSETLTVASHKLESRAETEATLKATWSAL